MDKAVRSNTRERCEALNGRIEAMYTSIGIRAALAIVPAALLSACVPQWQYDDLRAQNQELQAQVDRLQNAIRYTVNSDLLFASGSWQLSQDGKSVMPRVASQLAPYQTRNIVINGFTDNQPVGSQLRQRRVDSNEALSQRRAQAVMDFLASKGVQRRFMVAKGWGDAKPVAPNNSAGGRAKNRRVEITFGTAS